MTISKRNDFVPNTNGVDPVEMPINVQVKGDIISSVMTNEEVMAKLSIRDDIGVMFRDLKAEQLKEMKQALTMCSHAHLIELQEFIAGLIDEE